MKIDDITVNKDSEASPFIVQKDVILCRSGFQMYHKSDLINFITVDNKPPVEKEWYKAYRPATAIIDAKGKCQSLPVTMEHPQDWVTSHNFSQLAGGTTDNSVEVVTVEADGQKEVALKTNLTFYTDSLYDYYQSNREVSLGYTCEQHFVPNPEEVGYDIILDSIIDVNHLAITRAGRGGASVAIIDSITGGQKPMYNQKLLDAVAAIVKDSSEEHAAVIKGLFDSIIAGGTVSEEFIKAVMDSCNKKDSEETEQKDSEEEKKEETEQKDSETEETEQKDSEEKKEETEQKDSETEEQKDSETEEQKDSETEEAEQKDSEEKDEVTDSEEKEPVKDSLTEEKVTQIVRDSILGADLKELVTGIVKEALGIKENSKPKVEGSIIDSANNGKENSTRDYSAFLEA